MRKKRIIFVHQALWIGGIETALVNLLNQFDYNKYEVTCLIIQSDTTLADRIPKQCKLLVLDRYTTVSCHKKYRYGRLYGYTQPVKNPSKIHRIFMGVTPAVKWIENRLYIKYVQNFMKDKMYDTCIIYSDTTAEMACRAIRAKKYLMFYHHGAIRHVYHDRIGYEKSDRIIAVSEYLSKKLKKFIPQCTDKIVAIHNIINYQELRRKAEMPIKEKFDHRVVNIVTCGRISDEKGMDIAVKTCGWLVSHGYSAIRWWIIGGGPDENKVKKLILEMHLEAYICMVGMKKNPYPYIKNADLYVQPSRFEGYPMTVLEALVLGQPVISTNNTGAKEIIQDKETGYLCEVNEKALGNAIVDVYFEHYERMVTMRKNVASIDFSKKNRAALNQLEKII